MRSAWAWASRGAVIAAVVVAGCADGGGLDAGAPDGGAADVGAHDAGGSPADAGAPFRWAEQLARARCARLAACRPYDLLREHGEHAHCIEDLTAELSSKERVAQAALEAGTTRVRAGALAACLDTLANASCAGEVANEACELFEGTLDPSSDCWISEECRGGYCDRESKISCGRCREYDDTCGSGDVETPCAPTQLCRRELGQCEPAAGVGQPCAAGEGVCLEGLVCVRGDSGLTCQPRGAVDEPCTELGAREDTCDAGRGLRCEQGVCVEGRVGQPGDVCEATDVRVCAPGTFCEPTVRRCEPGVPEGQWCQRDDACERGTLCDVNNDVCRALGQEGEACELWLCAPGLECREATCQPVRWLACEP